MLLSTQTLPESNTEISKYKIDLCNQKSIKTVKSVIVTPLVENQTNIPTINLNASIRDQMPLKYKDSVDKYFDDLKEVDNENFEKFCRQDNDDPSPQPQPLSGSVVFMPKTEEAADFYSHIIQKRFNQKPRIIYKVKHKEKEFDGTLRPQDVDLAALDRIRDKILEQRKQQLEGSKKIMELEQPVEEKAENMLLNDLQKLRTEKKQRKISRMQLENSLGFELKAQKQRRKHQVVHDPLEVETDEIDKELIELNKKYTDAQQIAVSPTKFEIQKDGMDLSPLMRVKRSKSIKTEYEKAVYDEVERIHHNRKGSDGEQIVVFSQIQRQLDELVGFLLKEHQIDTNENQQQKKESSQQITVQTTVNQLKFSIENFEPDFNDEGLSRRTADFLRRQISKIQNSLKIPYCFRRQRLLGDLQRIKQKLEDALQRLDMLRKRAFSVERLVVDYIRQDLMTDEQLERRRKFL